MMISEKLFVTGHVGNRPLLTQLWERHRGSAVSSGHSRLQGLEPQDVPPGDAWQPCGAFPLQLQLWPLDQTGAPPPAAWPGPQDSSLPVSTTRFLGMLFQQEATCFS